MFLTHSWKMMLRKTIALPTIFFLEFYCLKTSFIDLSMMVCDFVLLHFKTKQKFDSFCLTSLSIFWYVFLQNIFIDFSSS